MTQKLTICIDGKPEPKARPRVCNGRTFDPKEKQKRAFRKRLAVATHGVEPLHGALMIQIDFHMPRPKKHYRTGKYSHLLKDTAPDRHTQKPDVDNLVKFLLDCGNGIVWDDDSQICAMYACKHWGELGDITERGATSFVVEVL